MMLLTLLMTQEDDLGNKYDDKYEQLIGVRKGQKSLKVLDSVKSIFGVDDKNYAFIDCIDIETVTFSENSALETIMNLAFYNCHKIKFLDLSVCKKLTTIGIKSFSYTSSMTKIIFPHSLKTIKNNCFRYSGLINVTIPNNVTKIEEQAFHYCTALQYPTFEDGIQLTNFDELFSRTSLVEVSIPSSVTSINSYAFHGAPTFKKITADNNSVYEVVNGMLITKDGKTLVVCPSSLSTETVYVPDGIEEIMDCAFHSSRAKYINISNTVKEIGMHCFRETIFTKIVIPDSVVNISKFAFIECQSLKEVTLSKSMKVIYENTFTNSGITSLVIPEGVEEIEDLSFSECSNLVNIFIPASVTKFGGGAFSKCPKVNITFAENSIFSIDNQSIISSEGKTVINQYIGEEKDAKIIIPNSVKRIKGNAFKGNTNIASVKFADAPQLYSIEEYAFDGCSSLTVFDFPPSLRLIGSNAFANTHITSLVLDNRNIAIGGSSFYGTYLSKVEFKGPLESFVIGGYAFAHCHKLLEITIPEGLKTLSDYSFYDCGLTTIELPTTLTVIGEHVFSGTPMRSITFRGPLKESLTINGYAFEGLTPLTSFQFVEGIKTISDRAFLGTSLADIKLPKSLETIGSKCFTDCVCLKNADLAEQGSKLATIGDDAFKGCKKLFKFSCKNDNFVIYEEALYNKQKTIIYAYPPASNAHFLYIPETVETISSNTFFECANIYTVCFPDDSSLTRIGFESFKGCTKLRIINIPKSVSIDGISASCFENCTSLLCGLIIENEDKNFKDKLIKSGKMPKRCFMSCSVYLSKIECTAPHLSRPLLFLTFMLNNY